MRTSYFDGKHLKGFNIPVSWDSDFGWDVYGKEVQGDELYGKVSGVFRALNLNADALVSLPFALVDKSGADFDTSEDWQNKVGFLPNPKKLFNLWRKSLAMTNTAYGKFERVKREMLLRYIVPTTMQPDVDREKGLIGWWRQVNGKRDYYLLSRGEIVWAYRMDYDTEVLPSKNTEFKALMASAGIMYYSDYFVEEFFMRGGIKPHMLMVKGVPNKDERDRIENTWDKLMKGLRQYIGKVYNAEAMEAIPIGSGVDDFKDNGFYRQALENVAMTTGIPLSLLLSNSANLATAQTEYRSWYENSVVPWANYIANELNDNLFARFDLRLEFRSEQAAPNQEEEVSRAQAFSTYATVLQKSGHPQAISLAAQIVGVDLPKGTKYEDLDERDEKRMQQDKGIYPELEKAKEEEEEKAKDEKKPPRKGFTPDADQLNELGTWQDIATRKIKKGLKLELPLTAKTLPEDVAIFINSQLESATTITDIKAAFDLSAMTITEMPQAESQSEIMTLAKAINKLAESKE